MLDNAGPIMTQLIFADDWNWIVSGVAFFLFTLLSALLILQMLIGVLCDVVSRLDEEQRDADAIGLVKQELLSELRRIAGEDGRISQTELLSVMRDKKSKAVLKKLNINATFLYESQRILFPTPGSKVAITPLLKTMLDCRGNDVATVHSLAGTFHFIVQELTDLKKSLVFQITGKKPEEPNRARIKTFSSNSSRGSACWDGLIGLEK